MQKYINKKKLLIISVLSLEFSFPLNAFASIDPLLIAYIIFFSPIFALLSIIFKSVYIKSSPQLNIIDHLTGKLMTVFIIEVFFIVLCSYFVFALSDEYDLAEFTAVSIIMLISYFLLVIPNLAILHETGPENGGAYTFPQRLFHSLILAFIPILFNFLFLLFCL